MIMYNYSNTKLVLIQAFFQSKTQHHYIKSNILNLHVHNVRSIGPFCMLDMIFLLLYNKIRNTPARNGVI